jgi:peptide methionine sulfoxide reductase MsrA
METITLAEYEQYRKLVEKHQKHMQLVKQYQQTHKNDPIFIENNRKKAKKHYENHKEEYHQKYIEKKNNKKIEQEIYNLMNISVY